MDTERENPVMPIPRDGDGKELRGEKRREYGGEEKVSVVGGERESKTDRVTHTERERERERETESPERTRAMTAESLHTHNGVRSSCRIALLG